MHDEVAVVVVVAFFLA